MKHSMRVTVMMDVAAGHLLGRRDTTFEGLAANMFELDRRVADLELAVKNVFEVGQNAYAL